MPRAFIRLADYSWSSQNRFKRLFNANSSDDDDIHSAREETELHRAGNTSSENNEPDGVSVNLEHSELQFTDSELDSTLTIDNEEQRETINYYRLLDAVEEADLKSDQRELESDSYCESMLCQSLIADEDSVTPSESHNGVEYEEESINDGRSECNELQSHHSDIGSDVESILSEEPNAVPQNSNLLYEGAPITKSESLISILSLSLRHNISDVLLTDILNCVALHCPPDNACPTTLYTFKKSFLEKQTPLVRHFYCTSCWESVETADSVCLMCLDQSKINYFIEGSIISQIRTLFKRPGFAESLQHRYTRDRQNPDHYEDIYDGAVYKDLIRNGGFLSNPVNISLTWYVDGVRIFKSSKINIWPLYLIINELPFALRTKKGNIIFAGLWFCDEKPFPNSFLRPLRQSISELYHGIDVEMTDIEVPLFVRGIIICGTCDLPAKALFLNMTQYNGRFGCQKCKDEGQYLRDERVRVYPYRPLSLRTDEETHIHAQQACDAGFAVCGVKGHTQLQLLVHEHMRATAVDAMHCVFEGVVKNLMNFWCSPQYSDHPSSLVQHNDLVNQRLLSLTPPSFVQRRPRSIKDRLAYWKAHELKAWFFIIQYHVLTMLWTRGIWSIIYCSCSEYRFYSKRLYLQKKSYLLHVR